MTDSPSRLSRRALLRGAVVSVVALSYRSAHAADPFTWAWFGVKLAEGAIAVVGGKLFQALVPGLLDNSDIIPRLAEAVREVVRVEIRKALTIQELAVLSAQLEAINRDIAYYERLELSTRRGSPGVIDNALTNIGNVMSQSSKYPLHGAHILSSAFSLRLIATHVKYKVIRDRGYIRSAKAEYEETSKKLVGSITEFRTLMKPENRIGPVTCSARPVPISRLGGGGTNTLYTCSFNKDGQPAVGGWASSYDSAGSAAREPTNVRGEAFAAAAAEEANGVKNFVDPLQQTMRKWKEALDLWEKSR